MSKETTKIVLNLHICLVLAAVVCLTIVGCENEPKPSPGKGRLVGKVTDLEGSPVSNCLVSLDSGVRTALTDQNGRYAFEDVEPKPSRMYFTKWGYGATSEHNKDISQANVVADATFRLDVVLSPIKLTADTTDPNYLAGKRFADQEIAVGYASWFAEGGIGSGKWTVNLNPNTGLPTLPITGCIINNSDLACIAGHNDRILQYISDGRMPPRPRWWQHMYDWLYRSYIYTGCPGLMIVNVDSASVTSDDSNTILCAEREDTSVVLDIVHRGAHFRLDLGNLPGNELRCHRMVDSLDIMIVGAHALQFVLVDLLTGQLVPIYRSSGPDDYPPHMHVGARKMDDYLPTPKVDTSKLTQ